MADTVVAVVGAGPAGLRAAGMLAVAGLRPIVIDEGARGGGQIYRRPPAGAERPADELYGFEAPRATRLHTIADDLAATIDYRASTLAWNLIENRLDTLGPGGHGSLAFDRLVLATGAMDRVIPFPGWTLPGVFTLGAAQIALKSQGLAIGRRVALVGAGPLLPLVAHQYARAGIAIAVVLDVTPFSAKARALPRLARLPKTLAKGLWYTAAGALRGHPIHGGAHAIAVEGDGRVAALRWTDGFGRRHRVACDAVGASFGLRSETQLADLAGLRFAYDRTLRQWLPERTSEGRTSRGDVYVIGDGAGIGGAEAAELQGDRAALAVIEDFGGPRDRPREARLDRALARQRTFRTALEAAYPYPDALAAAVDDAEIVCRCEGITAGALRAAARERGAVEMTRLKALTRVGMGRCQGRVCGLAAADILARATGQPQEAVGRLRTQPPVKPIPLAAGVA